MAIAPGYVANFETLCRAAKDGNVLLIECTDAKTGVPVIAMCAVERERNGDVTLKPLAKLFDGNPYEELIPPTLEETTP